MSVTPSNDDGFREIQLNGKQLVFLFMAVTVVLVVTFLTGVLVGRGVRAERVEAAQSEVVDQAPAVPQRTSVDPATNGSDPRTVAAPPAEPGEPGPDGKTAADTRDEQPPVAVVRSPRPEPAPAQSKVAEPAKGAESVKAPQPQKAAPPAANATAAASATGAPAPAASAKAANPAPTTSAAAAPSASATPDAPRNGYAVQVAAVNARGEADSIAKRLSGKGYTAYVEDPKGSQKMFRVRVGTFKTRRDAQTVADRLKKEEKFKPWVTR